MSDLVIQQMFDEMLIYDLAEHRAFCLNPSAAFVWQNCDGTATVAEIAKRFGPDRNGEEVVWLAVDQLAALGLLRSTVPPHFDRRSRRQVIKALGLTALLTLPVISTIATPRNNHGVGSVCVCVSSAQCLATPGCGNSCGPLGTCITAAPQVTVSG